MRILITGGAGYVGCPLAKLLLDDGHTVVILDPLNFGDGPLIDLLTSPNLIVHRGDVTSPHDLATASAGCDAVIHLAGLVGFPACRERPALARQVNVEGTAAVCRAFAGKPIINASTGSVYGDIEYLCDESSPCRPVSEYGKFKLEAEQIVLAAGGVSLRFATLFGMSPCMRLDLLPNNFVFRAVKNRHLILYRGSDRRTFLHVRDAGLAYLLTLQHFGSMAGEVYNVGDESLNMTKRELAHQVRDLFPMQILDEESMGTDPDLRNYEVSYKKFRTACGFAPRENFAASLREVGQFAAFADVAHKWRLTF